MKVIKPQMLAAIVIHAIIGIVYIGDPDYSFISYFVGGIVAFNLIGILVILMGHKIAGARIFMISSAILVPIGMIGALGARKIIDEEKRKNFNNNDK